jgi:hypothetical protein
VGTEIERSAELLEPLGAQLTCLRAPYGLTSAELGTVVAQHDLTLQGWDVDTRDWARPGAQAIAAAALGYLHNLDAVGREEFLTDAGGSGILGGYDFLYDAAAARGEATEDYGPYTISVDHPAELREWLEDNPQWVQDGRTPHPTGGYVTREVSTRNGMVTERYLDAEGWLHQEEGPALCKQDDLWDQQFHYRHGVLHNENGPAVLERSQTSTMRKWYVNGQEVARKVETLSPGWGLQNGRPVKETS